ncbi:DUF5134 domain-containing protein [Streptomyces sp. NBC_01335]|uniref:DUF5134 domain-containing protein n=1 Tax=Streptomyces sp. NBC_01335 TaxID=2903828 RepID=UPI002E13EBCC|nr:DUF5134 domain-containing protein [Streptomyces sp. NBC_01335]
MHGPALSGWLLMVLCAATGAYCLLRARAGSGEERRAAHAEALMGFGMAAMAVPAALLTPPGWAWAAYTVLFGGAALRSAWAARRGGHHLHHLVGSLAMVYMAVTMGPSMAPGAGGGPHAGHAGAGTAAGLPLLTGALLVYYALYVLGAAGRLIPVAAGAGAGTGAGTAAVTGGRRARPELALACRVTMGLAMLAMLAGL